MDKKIVKTAEKFQLLARKAKELDAEMKPLKAQLIEYADKNRDKLDESFQLKFPNGTFVSLRVKDIIKADDEALNSLVSNLKDEYLETTIKDKKLILAAKENKRIMKLITANGAKIEQKETFAVFAG